MQTSTAILGAQERTLGRAELLLWQRAYQMLIGFLLVPLFARFRGHFPADWQLLPFFLCVLLALRIAPMVVRRLVPFAADLQTEWCTQRTLAKRYDSYQWRKLVWFGIGLGAYAAAFDRTNGILTFLALSCVVSGGLGAVAWRRVARTKQVMAILSAR